MAINQEIRNGLPENTLVFDNASYDNSIIGVSFDGKAIYLFEKMVKEYMQDNDCDEICAVEWIEYNTIRSLPYFGEKSPIIVYGEWSDAYDCIITDIDDAPTADVAIVKHAKWIGKNGRDYYTCSNCCVVAKSKDDAYCRGCGAKMDGWKERYIMAELLPCPFCGGKPFVYISGNKSCGFFEEIVCKKCGCRTDRLKEGIAKDVWNTRTPKERGGEK